MRNCYWLGLVLGLTQAACSSDSKPAATTESGAPTKPAAPPAQVRQLMRQFLPSAQSFTINPSRDTMLRGAQGTEIRFRAGSLAVPKGKGPVTLTLREFYTPADMVLAGLSTRAGRRLLETGGMLQIEASGAGQPLQLRAGATMGVRMPTRRAEPGMQLFAGQPAAAGRIDWVLVPPRPPRERPAVDTIVFDMSAVDSSGVGYPEAEVVRSSRQRRDYEAATAAVTPNRLRRGTPAAAATAAPAAAAASDSVFYAFELANLGWINCDRFLDSKQPLIDVPLPVDEETQPEAAYLVFKSIRSVLAADSAGPRQAVFRQVPLGASATVVVLKQHQGQLQLATQAVKLRPDLSTTVLTFRPVTPAQLRAALQQLK